MERLLSELRDQHIELEAQNQELVAAQLEVGEARDRYLEIFQSAPAGYLILDPQATVLEANLAAGRLLGVEPTGLIGRTLDMYLSETDAQTFRAHRSEVFLTGEPAACEVRLRRTGGAVIPVRVDSIAVGGHTRTERQCRSILIDVSERRRLEQVHRLEAIGTLASGVAHDFNNLLTGIIGCADRALAEVDQHLPACAHVEQIRGAAQSGASMVRQLMSLGNSAAQPGAPLHADTVVSGVEGMLRRLIGEDIEFRVTLGAPEAYLTCAPGQIEQILMNLVVNARQAMPRGGLVTVQTSEVDLQQAPARAIGRLQPGSHIRLLVSDTGCGMDEETQLHVYEPFFTTRPAGEGTGLGLPTVFGIVTQQKGVIELRSEPDKGTTFIIHLPSQRAGQKTLQPTAADGDCRTPPGGETVLVVEDEPLVRGAVQHYLEKAGYRVLAAGSGAEALRLCREHGSSIELLLTDMVLPGGMTGPEIAREAKELVPGAVLVYMSAYPPERLVQRGLLEPGVESLEKPFTQEALLGRVRHALAESRRLLGG